MSERERARCRTGEPDEARASCGWAVSVVKRGIIWEHVASYLCDAAPTANCRRARKKSQKVGAVRKVKLDRKLSSDVVGLDK